MFDYVSFRRISRVCLFSVLIAFCAAANSQDYPIAGLKPDQRPAEAPVISEFKKGPGWYERALRGVTAPYPQSFKFLENQGEWYTPFNYKGMTGPYDIRNTHTN